MKCFDIWKYRNIAPIYTMKYKLYRKSHIEMLQNISYTVEISPTHGEYFLVTRRWIQAQQDIQKAYDTYEFWQLVTLTLEQETSYLQFAKRRLTFEPFCSFCYEVHSEILAVSLNLSFSGTYTLSEIYGRSNRERVCKLPSFDGWDTHKLAALQFTAVSSTV